MHAQKKELVLILDVESDGATAVLAVWKAGERMHICASAHSELSYEDRSSDAYAIGMRTSIDEVVEKMLVARTHITATPLARVYITFHAPWVDTRVVRAEVAEQTDIHVTRDVITAIAHEAMRRENMNPGDHIESSIIRTELNGYRTAKPFDKYARHIGLTLLASTCSDTIRTMALSKTEQLHLATHPQLRSNVRGLIMGAATIPSTPTASHTILDIGRNMSRIIHVTDNLPNALSTIPYGVQHIFEHIDDSKHPADIMAHIRLIDQDSAEQKQERDFLSRIARAESTLIGLYAEAFSEIGHQYLLPSSLILVAPHILLPWLSRFFARSEFASTVITHTPFIVTPLENEHFDQWVEVEDGIEVRLNARVATALVYNELKNGNPMLQ